MNRLYHVSCYSSRHNQFTRYLVTVRETQTVRDAETQVIRAVGSDYRISHVTLVCMTPDTVFTEV